MAGFAKSIATDLIAQMAAQAAITPWVVPVYNAAYDRAYISDLEDITPAGDPASQMQIVIAPVETEYERTGWGGARITVTLGILFNVAVKVANGEVTDPKIDAYEEFVDDVCAWLVGPRQFAGGWNAKDPMPIFGDHYNDHLYGKMEFHVPVLVEFFFDCGVT